MHFSQKPCERSHCEHGRKGKDLFWLERAGSFGTKGHVRRTYGVRAFLEQHSIRGRNLFYPTDPRNNDRLTHARKSAKKLSDFRKSLHVQRLGDVYESQGLVLLSGTS